MSTFLEAGAQETGDKAAFFINLIEIVEEKKQENNLIMALSGPATAGLILGGLAMIVLCNCLIILPIVVQAFVVFYEMSSTAIAYGAQMGRYLGVHLLSTVLHIILLPILVIISLFGGFLVGFLRRVFRLIHAVAWSLCGKFLKEYISIPPANGLGGPIICASRVAPLSPPPVFIGHDFYCSFLCCCSDPFSTDIDKQFGGLCRCCDESRCKNHFRGTDFDNKDGYYKCSCCWSPLQKCYVFICVTMSLLVVYGLSQPAMQLGVPTLIGLFLFTIFVHIPVGCVAVLVSFPFYSSPIYTSLPIALERAGSLAGSALGDFLGWIVYYIFCFTLECRQLGRNRKNGGQSSLCLQLLKGGITSTLPVEVYLNDVKDEIVMGRPKDADFVPRVQPTSQVSEDKKIVTANPSMMIPNEQPVIIAVDQDRVGVWQLYTTTGLITHVENFSTPTANSQPLSPSPILSPPIGGCGNNCGAPVHTGLCLRCEKNWIAHNNSHVCMGGGRGSWLISEPETNPQVTAPPSKPKMHWIPEHFRSNHGKNEYYVKCVGEVKDTILPKWIKQLETDSLSERTSLESQIEVNNLPDQSTSLAAEKARLETTLLALKKKEDEEAKRGSIQSLASSQSSCPAISSESTSIAFGSTSLSESSNTDSSDSCFSEGGSAESISQSSGSNDANRGSDGGGGRRVS